MCDLVGQSDWFRAANSIAFYAPFDGEIECGPLLKLARDAGKACYLPTIAGSSLVFREATDTAVNNRFGISEPQPSAPSIAAADLDLIFVPLVGFDAKCNRIGMGKGFYDRALAATGTLSPIRLGVGWACQQVNPITPLAHDIPMHAVATESGWIPPSAGMPASPSGTG